jgi:hypothetical protein
MFFYNYFAYIQCLFTVCHSKYVENWGNKRIITSVPYSFELLGTCFFLRIKICSSSAIVHITQKWDKFVKYVSSCNRR